eukprot:CAMPEP_0204907844 /NCGR_PEP_ID=MMETSP1397-20131031/6907_1 /ASSEMBLY_ACC=CAM_ASM_000891 /TAXON_ID=49980 /ORGANISM="Climacostomum Climacostomum virens, Strain Stock W-24" /LENGTH=1058 /DNA_ID=CAMNT_0052077135 /DNA_START=8 /DNA_END=3184 /DNA_ORIENTATION=+
MDFGSARQNYQSRLSSLTTSLRSLYDDRDELIDIMREDPVSERFIPAHIEELYSSQARTGKDRAVDHILSELNSTQESLNELMRQRSQLTGSLKNKQQSEEYHKERSKTIERKLKDSQQVVEDMKRSVTQLSQNYEDRFKQQQAELNEIRVDNSKEVRELRKALEKAVKEAFSKDVELSKLHTILEKETSKRELFQKQLEEIKREYGRKEAYYSETESRLQMSLQQSSNASSSLQIAEERIEQLSVSLDELHASKQEQEQKFLEFYSQVKNSIEEEQKSHVDAMHQLKQRLARKLGKAKNKLADSEISRVELEDALNKCSNELEGAKIQYEQLCREHEDKLEQFDHEVKQLQSSKDRQVEELKSRHESELQQANRQYSHLLEQKMKEFQQETGLIKSKAREREQDISESYEQKLREQEDSMISRIEHARLCSQSENHVREEMKAAHAILLENLRQQLLNSEKDYSRRVEEERAAGLLEQQQLKNRLQEAETRNLLVQKDVERYLENLSTLKLELAKSNGVSHELRDLNEALKEKVTKSAAELEHMHRLVDSLSKSKTDAENALEEAKLSKAEFEIKTENKLEEYFAELRSLKSKKQKQLDEIEEIEGLNEALQDKLNSAEAEITTLFKEKQRLGLELEDLRKTSTVQVSALRTDFNKRLEASVLEVEETKAKLELTANRLTKANIQLEHSNEQVRALRSTIETLSKDNGNLSIEVRSLEAEIDGKKAEHLSLSRDYDTTFNDIKRRHAKKLKKLLLQAAGLKQELADVKNFHKRATAVLWKNITEELLQGGEELEQKNLVQQRDFLMLLRDKQQELEDERTASEEIKQKMTKLVEQAIAEMKHSQQTKIQEINSMSEELQQKEEEVEKCREEIAELKGQGQHMRSELDKIRTEADFTKKQAAVELAKQQKKLSKTTDVELSKASQQHTEQLTQLFNRIEKLKAESLAQFKNYEAEIESLNSHYQSELDQTLNRTKVYDDELSAAEQTSLYYSDQVSLLEQELKSLQQRSNSKLRAMEIEVSELQSTIDEERARFKLYKQEKTREIESLKIKLKRMDEL